MTETTVSEAVLNQVAADIHATAQSKGFWEPPVPFFAEINTKLMLIVSEVTEAQEVFRKHYDDSPVHPYTQMTEMQHEDFIEELADVAIRTFDLAEYFAMVTGSLGDAILAKMARNANRPPMHGKRF